MSFGNIDLGRLGSGSSFYSCIVHCEEEKENLVNAGKFPKHSSLKLLTYFKGL
jgi:hypothetical protein